MLIVAMALLSMTTAAAQGPRSAPPGAWSRGIRIQTSAGYDSNTLELLDPARREGDSFLRILGEGTAGRTGLFLGSTGELNARMFVERYTTQPREDRAHGEVRLAWDRSGPGVSARTRIEGGFGARDYPDSTSRNYRRGWGRLSSGFRLGPSGTLVPRLEYWTLDFSRTPRRDQSGARFDLAYEIPLRSWLVLQPGLELGGIRHGLSSIQLVSRRPDEPPELDLETPDRHDTYRVAHLSLRVLRRGVVRFQYAFRSQGSNSIDAALQRHEFRWLISQSLPLGLVGQLYGNLEHTKYTDRDLDRVLVLRSGELEAGEDDNTVALRMSRYLGRGWAVDGRHSWYRNESLLIQNYYRKQVWTFGLSWEAGRLSAF